MLLCARKSKVQQRSWGVNGKEVVELGRRGIHIGRAVFLFEKILRLESILAERDERIDLRSALRGNETSEQSYGRKQQRDRCECEGIGSRH
jgi:hypothetical protein